MTTREGPLFTVSNLNAHYGRARALEDVSFEMTKESVAIIGRNGMGKTTLCNAIMAITPPQISGSIRFRGEELVGKASHAIAARGVGYVPQGRRLFPSLSVDEHLRMIRPARPLAGDGRAWTVDGVYDMFPRLAERRKNGGAQLSGGEQQMLAIGRAMLTNPLLLIMDEPSEGLAPAIVENLIGVFRSLEESGLAIILIEQNLSVATAVARRQLVMVAGRIFTETTAEDLINDPAAQQRFLGVEPLQQHEA
ncbi:MAG: ABC transporter ATP-binding protein [Gaiellales bacterium]